MSPPRKRPATKKRATTSTRANSKARPRTKSRSTKSWGESRSWTLRLVVIGLVLLLAAGVSGLKWSRTLPGQIWLAERGAIGARAEVKSVLERAIRSAAAAQGIPADSIVVRPAPPEGITTYEIGSTVELLQLNTSLTAAVADVGGSVHRGQRYEKDRAAVLELTLGTPELVTHRVVARWGPAATEIVPPPPPVGRLAIVIDDWGHQIDATARNLLELPVPITVAILPERPHSLRILNEAKRLGKEAILHMPMEPSEGADPGPGPLALRVDMGKDEIRALVERCLDGLPGVEGLNNHMGSRFTEGRRGMEVVLDVVSARGLYFLDSLTSPRSVAYDLARQRELPALRNDLFLDVETDDPDLIEQRLWTLVELARRRGVAIGIGHVHPATAEALKRVLLQLNPQDVRPVFLSDLLLERIPG